MSRLVPSVLALVIRVRQNASICGHLLDGLGQPGDLGDVGIRAPVVEPVKPA